MTTIVTLITAVTGSTAAIAALVRVVKGENDHAENVSKIQDHEQRIKSLEKPG